MQLMKVKQTGLQVVEFGTCWSSSQVQERPATLCAQSDVAPQVGFTFQSIKPSTERNLPGRSGEEPKEMKATDLTDDISADI